MLPLSILCFALLIGTGWCEETKAEPKPEVEAVKEKVNLAFQGETIPDEIMEEIYKRKVVKRVQNTLKQVKQLDQGLIEGAVRTNFLHSLYLMANSTAITGANVSRAAGTIIRGFVQDQFNLVSIGFYFPRLIFLDGPSQFIETLRLIRTNQIQIPRDMDSAIDTLINFATHARESQIAANLGTPFLSIFPNIFRGSELLSGEILYSVFQWLAPLAPGDISAASVEGLWNRWDNKASTTDRYNFNNKNDEKYYSLRKPSEEGIPGQQVNGGKVA